MTAFALIPVAAASFSQSLELNNKDKDSKQGYEN